MTAEPTPGSSWWSWSYWRGSSVPPAAPSSVQPQVKKHEPEPIVLENTRPSTSHDENGDVQQRTISGWDRVLNLYEEPSMEVDVVQRVGRMTFFAGFLMGGATGYVHARQTYETTHTGTKYLSKSDYFKRRIDYAIVRFAKSGFGMGVKCALISGSIVLLSTHLAAYRNKFSSWYFPALSGALAFALHSAAVGGVFAFPLGVAGCAKAAGLGVSSGITLAAVVHLYAMGIDKSVDMAYWQFKRDYEKELYTANEWDRRVKEYMKNENIMWRQAAVKQLREADAKKLEKHDD